MYKLYTPRYYLFLRKIKKSSTFCLKNYHHFQFDILFDMKSKLRRVNQNNIVK